LGQKVIGFPALKGDFLIEDICKFATNEEWNLQTDYHFGGYGKVSAELINFINGFKKETQIPLDPIYTGKMMFGILDMVKKDKFEPDTKILAIHTGGLQGIVGMNKILKKKNLPLIDL
jgi:1-aminocyclopropane-1-carboxylate deaminase